MKPSQSSISDLSRRDFLKVLGFGTIALGLTQLPLPHLKPGQKHVIEKFDTDGFHNYSSTSRLTVPSGLSGMYLVTANVLWNDNIGIAGPQRLEVFRNGHSLGYSEAPLNSKHQFQQVVQMHAGDWVELRPYGSLQVMRLDSGVSV